MFIDAKIQQGVTPDTDRAQLKPLLDIAAQRWYECTNKRDNALSTSVWLSIAVAAN